MAWSTRSLIFLISLPVTVCAALLYYLHKKEDEWEEGEVLSAENRVVEMRVPTERVAGLIGRAGANIKRVQDQTDTRINFKDATVKNEKGEFRVCRIRGSQENIEKAEKLLLDLLYNRPEIITSEIWVPQNVCGRIIGRCGENIKTISSQSNAHIIVDPYRHNSAKTSGSDKEGRRQVLMKGTAQEVAVASSIISRIVEEEQRCRSTLRLRPPRLTNSPKRKTEEEVKPVVPVTEELTSPAGVAATSTDGMIQVYVSSVATPHNFWVQMVSPRSVELDHLVEDMTEFYNKQENRDLHQVQHVTKGQIVAAPFDNDSRWYRVEVCGVEAEPAAEDGSPVLDIFYVDYGDSGYIPQSKVLELRTDFLSLRFQAIECRLANIEMKEGEEGWSEEGISEFEQLVYSAQWKRIMVRICGYHPRTDLPPLPIVRLFDPALGLDAAEELIKKGFGRSPDPAPIIHPELVIS